MHWSTQVVKLIVPFEDLYSLPGQTFKIIVEIIYMMHTKTKLKINTHLHA